MAETLLAIDPGNTDSAFLIYDGARPVFRDKCGNHALLNGIRGDDKFHSTHCAIETLKPRGMPTAFEEMQAQLWAGRFIEAWNFVHRHDHRLVEAEQIFRMDVKMFHCGKTTAKDSNIRQALIDRFGGQDKAIGGNRCPVCKGKGWTGRERKPCDPWLNPPGPLHGVTADVWSALAIAVYWWETKRITGPAAGSPV